MKKSIELEFNYIPRTPRNDIRYENHGWRLVGGNAYFDYQSQLPHPNRWIVQPAVHDDGREGFVLWYFTEAAEAVSDRTNDGADWVRCWEKCYGVIVD